MHYPIDRLGQAPPYVGQTPPCRPTPIPRSAPGWNSWAIPPVRSRSTGSRWAPAGSKMIGSAA